MLLVLAASLFHTFVGASPYATLLGGLPLAYSYLCAVLLQHLGVCYSLLYQSQYFYFLGIIIIIIIIVVVVVVVVVVEPS